MAGSEAGCVSRPQQSVQAEPKGARVEPALYRPDGFLLRGVVLAFLDGKSDPLSACVARRRQAAACGAVRRLGFRGLHGASTAGAACRVSRAILGADYFRGPLRRQRRVASVLRARADAGLLGRVRGHRRRRHRATCSVSLCLALASCARLTSRFSSRKMRPAFSVVRWVSSSIATSLQFARKDAV